MIKIDKNVPMPEKGNMGDPKYPFKLMEVGDSFALNTKKVHNAYGRINVATARQHKTTIRRYTIRNIKSSNEVRVWRIK